MTSMLDYIDQEIEQAALGSLIKHNPAITEFTSKDFAVPVHQSMFEEMERLFSEQHSFSVMDFMNFRAEGLPDEMKAMNYLQECSHLSFDQSEDQIKAYRDCLKSLFAKRRLYQMFETGLNMLEDVDANQINQWIHSQSIESLECGKIKTGHDVFTGVLQSFEKPKSRWSTGLKPFDKGMQGGLYQGYTYGLAGQEKAGKTTFAHTISYNLSEIGCKHLYVALEMGSEQIEMRNIARKLGINSMKFLESDPSLESRVKELSADEYRFYLDAPAATYDELIREISSASIKHGISGFIIDYWQLVGGIPKGKTEEAHLRSVAQGFADFARKNGLFCILLAQLNKEGQLFGGNGLRKACDQLYFIKQPSKFPSHRWLEMDATRYTLKADIGDDECPAFMIDKFIGPYFKEA